jgi:hypothetical protein
MSGWGCTDFNGYTAYCLIEKLLDKQMLLSCTRSLRLAVFTCGFWAASTGALRDSVAQINEDISARDTLDTMIVDPAPTPYPIVDYQKRSTGRPSSERDQLSPNRNDFVPAPIAENALEYNPASRDARPLADPEKMKWSVVGSEPISPDTMASMGEAPEQIEQLPNPDNLAPRSIAHGLSVDNVDDIVSHQDGSAGLARSSSLLSPHYDSCGFNPSSRHRLRWWLDSEKTSCGVAPDNLWANYPPCGCPQEGGRFGRNGSYLRAAKEYPRSPVINYALSGSDLNRWRDLESGRTSKSHIGNPLSDDQGDRVSEPMSIALSQAFEKPQDLPQVSNVSFAGDPVGDDASGVPSGQIDAISTLVIHPPLVQPYRENQYTFVVENRGDEVVTNLTVQLEVGDSAKIFGALPSESLVLDQAALFRVEMVPPHGYVELHIGVISLDDSPIAFQANVSTTSQKDFRVTQSSKLAVLQQVGSTTDAGRFQSANQAEVPNVEPCVEQKLGLPGGAEVVRNPYYDKNGPAPDKKTWMQRESLNRVAMLPSAPSQDAPSFSVLEIEESGVVVNFNDHHLGERTISR